jgi:hypothetical protein
MTDLMRDGDPRKKFGKSNLSKIGIESASVTALYQHRNCRAFSGGHRKINHAKNFIPPQRFV